MKTIVVWVFVFSWLFAGLDWQVVHLTRWTHPEYKEWMHTHETEYKFITNPIEWALCLPCMAVKPVMVEAFKRVSASQPEQDAITHAPTPDLRGFYHLPERGMKWTFVPWTAWFLYWTPPTLVWLWIVKGLFHA